MLVASYGLRVARFGLLSGIYAACSLKQIMPKCNLRYTIGKLTRIALASGPLRLKRLKAIISMPLAFPQVEIVMRTDD
jgi:hypothetical protein